MLEVSSLASKIETILNVNTSGLLFKIFTDVGELDQNDGLRTGTESKICGLLEIISNDLSGEGLKFQDIVFQLTWFVDGKRTGGLGHKKAEMVEKVRNVLTAFAEAYNNKNVSSENFNNDYYSTTYFVQLPTNQTEQKNFGYMVSCVPMTQTIELVLIENGVSSNQWDFKANGEKLVYQSLSISNEKQADNNIISNEKRTRGVILASGICFDMVLQQLKTDFCNFVEKDVLDYENDNAVCVYVKGNHTTNIYICVLGNDSVNLQIGANSGLNVSLVEAVEDLLTYDSHWKINTIVTTSANEVVSVTAKGHIFWGDGGKTINANGNNITHTFEEIGTYTVRTYGETFTVNEPQEETEEGGGE